MNRNDIKVILIPVVLAVAIIIGMMLGRVLPGGGGNARGIFLPVSGSKLDVIIGMIQHSYVDSVNTNEIVERTIPVVLQDLDPHTVYIPAKDMQRVNEGIVGNFGGIGIQFYKYMDTVVVVKVVPGGPSEKEGILDGDRVIQVGDSVVAGRKMDTNKIMGMMRGEMGTKVELTLVRRGEPKPLKRTIVRGSIPVKSVDVAFMADDTTGYVKVGTFGMNTLEEFLRALSGLQEKGMRKLIIDLRDNEGGVLPIAIRMVNEFLPKDALIVYTQGKAQPRQDYTSNGKGRYQTVPLVVLINEYSASASEIFAGAIQDNDRGLIVGRRSFGKGLVQEQRGLQDGSAIRLTVARYYSPSGRSIQKPYDEGKEKYYYDIYNRAIHGEFSEKDSIAFDENLRFQTSGGRTVYGGGGIMPDIFVPADTVGASRYFANLVRGQLLYEYTFEFMDKHRKGMTNLKDTQAILDYLKRVDLVNEVVNYAAKRGLKRDEQGIKTSNAIIRCNTEAFIARHLIDDEGFYPVLFRIDDTFQKALTTPANVLEE